MNCEVIADRVVPSSQSAFRLCPRGQQLHGEFMVWSKPRHERRINCRSFCDRLLMFALNHISLSEIQSDAKYVGAVGTGHASERRDQFAEQLLGRSAISHADETESQPLLEGQTGAFVKSRQDFGALESGPEISRCELWVI